MHGGLLSDRRFNPRPRHAGDVRLKVALRIPVVAGTLQAEIGAHPNDHGASRVQRSLGTREKYFERLQAAHQQAMDVPALRRPGLGAASAGSASLSITTTCSN